VTSPQALAAMVVRKAASMARQLQVPIIGVVENLSYVACPGSGEWVELFGPSHSDELAATLGTELLGRLPVDAELAAAADAGLMEQYAAEWFRPVAERVLARLPQEQHPAPFAEP